MTSRDFCYWLQGYFEIHESETSQTRPLGFGQIDCIKKHLSLVFAHEIDKTAPAEEQAKLNAIHGDTIVRC